MRVDRAIEAVSQRDALLCLALISRNDTITRQSMTTSRLPVFCYSLQRKVANLLAIWVAGLGWIARCEHHRSLEAAHQAAKAQIVGAARKMMRRQASSGD